MNDKEFKVIKLEKDNYIVWKWQFSNILRAKGLAKAIESDITKREELSTKEDSLALALLGSALSDENILKIINCTKFTEAWRKIESCFENKSAYEPQSLHQRLNSFRIKSASEVASGLGEMQGLVAQLRNLNETVSDNAFIGAILSALPASFDIFATVWKNSADKNVDGLISKLMAEATDQALKHKNDDQALAAKTNVKGKNKSNNKSKEGNQFNKDQCRYCKETGHWIQNCPNLKTPYDPNKRKSRKTNNPPNSNSKNDNAGKDLAFVSVSRGSKVLDSHVWVADSGCTNHMSPFKELFSSLMVMDGSIHMADDTKIKIHGKGEISTKVGKLTNVLYVPELGQNLFSISAAASCGLTHVGTKDGLKFYSNKQEIFHAELEHKLYLIKFQYNHEISCAATLDEWHARFNHVSTDAIKLMQKNKIVNGLDIVSNSKQKCQDCALNKCTNVNHPTKITSRAKQPGQVLHVDTSGPSNVVSRGGSKYLILCKDEHSSYRQVKFASTKDQIPNLVKALISQTQLETGNSVLKLKTDNGTEFVNRELQTFLTNKGIVHDLSAPYVPSQNGFVERDLRTVKEAAKTMLTQSKVDKSLWPEAINCAIYTLNRVINSSNTSKTPYELWFGSPPNVRNLHIFGELAIIKNKDTLQKGSWHHRGSKAIFLGYTEHWNTFRFLLDNKVVVRCDCVFMNKMSDSKTAPKETQEADHYWINDISLNEDHNNDLTDDEVSALDISDLESPQDNFGTPEPSSSRRDAPEQEQSNREQACIFEEPLISINDPTVVVSAPSGLSDRAQQRDNEVKRCENIFEKHANETFEWKIGDRSERFQFKDLTYKPNSSNWRNTKIGRFMNKDLISRLADSLEAKDRRRPALVSRALITQVKIPTSYAEALSSPEAESWKEAIKDEAESLLENNVYEEIPTSEISKKPVASRWVFTVKRKPNGEIEKYKARVVAKGFSQIYGIDYMETYCSVVHVTTTRLLLSYAALKQLYIKQFDIKTAFLYGDLDEKIFMQPPEGLSEKGTTWLLKRSLYGLKQSPRMWNQKFKSFLESLGLQVSSYDNSVFYRLDPIIILIVYVDDGLVFTQYEKDASILLSHLSQRFKMRELEVSMYRGLQIEKLKDGIFVHQTAYVKKLLDNFNMAQANSVENPILTLDDNANEPLSADVPFRSAIGSLSYLADMTRPDIAYIVNKVARKSADPTNNDWKKVKHLLRYVKGTINLGIMFPSSNNNQQLIGFSDSDFAGDNVSSKSTTGYAIMYNDAPVHWKSQLQRHVSLSSSEAEVIALCSLAKELAYMRRLCLELQITDEQAIIFCDNTSAIKIATSEKATNRTRHLRAQNAYVREQINLKELTLLHVPTTDQLADILTKPVSPKKNFIYNRDKLLVDKPIL